MTTADEIVHNIHRLIYSEAATDEVLRRAVGALKDGRRHYDWVGIYLLEDDTLVLHNYVGKPTEHTRIQVGSGICGEAVSIRSNLVVGDVTKVENYLACSVETRAEIVVLIRRGDEIFGQIDIDSDTVNAFSDEDEILLMRVGDLLSKRF
jgi:GAF domain-containing protein